MDIDIIKLRSKMNKTIRNFFDEKDFLEVDTPILSPDLIPETAIEIFKTSFHSGHGNEKELYLIPSPEIWMKRLLSEGSGSCYQICRSFRNMEQTGRIHNPEFTMLEWYETETDYVGSMKTTEELFARFLPLGAPESWAKPFKRMSMEEAFREYTDEEIFPWCLPGEEGMESLKESLRRLGHGDYNPESWEEGFNLLFVHHVEPVLPAASPLIIYDYPQRIPTLSAEKEGTPWSQRWELYIEGCELANCFTEERNPHKIRNYYAEEAPFKDIEKKKPAREGHITHLIDHEYHRFFHKDFPRVSGVAMGLDRLLMLIGRKPDLRGVILFPVSDILGRH